MATTAADVRVLVRRSYTYSDTEALAKERRERLRREIQTDAVQQIVRRSRPRKADRNFRFGFDFQISNDAGPSCPACRTSGPGFKPALCRTATSRCWRSKPTKIRCRSRGGYDDRETWSPGPASTDALAAANRNLACSAPPSGLLHSSSKPGLSARVPRGLRQPSERRYADADHPCRLIAGCALGVVLGFEEAGARSLSTRSNGRAAAWIAARLARQKQRASADTLQLLADTTEGNLLAAQQEVQKLGLLLPEGELDPAAVEQAVADVARFDVFQLSEAWLAGDAARACRILASLEAAGEGLPLLLWQLGEDIHALAAVLAAAASGTPVGVAVRSARVWGKRQAAMERAAQRVAPAAIPRLLTRLDRLDALAKGIGRGNAFHVPAA
jgi:hypothetical protein